MGQVGLNGIIDRPNGTNTCKTIIDRPNGINTCKAMNSVINLCINNNLSYRDSLAKDYLNIIDECEKRRKETACESFYVNLT